MPSWRDPEAPTPLWFGSAELPLFGVLHPAGGAALGVLVCGSIGNEGVVEHRALRLLARRLAAAGHPTFRFDPPGSGDSFGDDDLPRRIAAWREAMGAAVAELRLRAGVDDVALVGIRLGATVGASAVDEGLDVAALVLWDAPATGEGWLRHERVYHRLAQQVPPSPENPPPPEGAEESAGFLLTAETVDELRALALQPDGAPTWRTGLPVLLDAGSRDLRKLEAALAARGAAVTERRLPGVAEMLEELEQAAPPTEAIDAIVSWLAGLPDPAPPDASPAPPADGGIVCDGVRETPLPVEGGRGRLFAIAAEPGGRPARGGRWAVLYNAGFVRHIGPNRMYVRWAREWALRGLPSLRVDGRSIGESDGLDGPHRTYDELYSPGALQDALEHLRMLRRFRGPSDLVLLGLCSGAYMAFHVALRSPDVRTIVLLNPPTLNYDVGDSEQGRALYVLRSLRSGTRWRALLSRRSAARQLRERSALLLRVLGRNLLRRLSRSSMRGENWLADSLARLQDAGIAVHFVMSEGDSGLAYLERHLGPSYERAPAGSFTVHLLGSADHTFRPLGSQLRLRAVLDEILGTRAPEPDPAVSVSAPPPHRAQA